MTTIHAQQTPKTQKYLLIILGFFRRWQRSPLFLGLLTFVAAGGVITAEISNNLPRGIILSLPLAGILVFWNLFAIIKKSEKLLNLFSFPKILISAPLLIFFILGTCTPALYLSPTWKHHPFNDIHWLVVCLFGLLFLLALINWNLCRTSQLSTGMYSVFKKLWNMPAHCFLGCVILWILIITCFFSYNVFGNIPHVNDAIAQFFQAKIFATGKLTAALPPIPDFFQYTYDNIIMAERWYSQYPPGHPFFLMLGLLIKAPWLTNPIFAALSAILLYKCALLYYGAREARLSTLLYCVSPFILFMSASFMNHVSTLFFILLALYAIKKSLMKNRAGFACLAGFSLGIVLNIRTGDSIALFFPIGIYFLICSFRQRQYHLPVYFALCFACMLAILLSYNAATNGDPFLFGYQVRWGQEHSMGFSNVSVMGIPPHTPLRGIIKTLRNLIVLNQNLFEWPFPSFLPLYLLWLPFLFKKDFNDYFFLCCLLAIPVFYFFYFYQDLCLGPRFLYSSLPFIFILTAKSILIIIDTITKSGSCSRKGVKCTFINLFCLCVIFAAVVRTPKLYRFYADSFWDVDTKLMEKAKQMSLDNALIFQKSYHQVFTDLGSGFLYNSPTLDSPIVFARDLGRRNIELVSFFAGRTCYLATRDQKNNISIHQLPFSSAGSAAAQFQKAE